MTIKIGFSRLAIILVRVAVSVAYLRHEIFTLQHKRGTQTPIALIILNLQHTIFFKPFSYPFMFCLASGLIILWGNKNSIQ
jgi:hypothetical protein